MIGLGLTIELRISLFYKTMYVKNPEVFKDLYFCKENVYKFLIKNGIPLFSKKDGFYCFRKTKDLNEVILKIPWWILILDGDLSLAERR